MMLRRLASISALAGALASSPWAIPTPPAAYTLSPITGPEARRPAEVSVAINPLNADHVVAVSLQSGRIGEPRTVSYSYTSSNGGLTWSTATAARVADRTQGDDAAAFGPDGIVYHSFISFEGIRTARPMRALTGIFVASSRDGSSWSAPTAVIDHINTVAPFEDKPYLGVDGVDGSSHRGNIYVAWTRFSQYGSKDPADTSHILFARSRDGGRSFAPALRISDAPGDAVDSDGTLEGALPAVGPDGQVYLVWGGPKGLVFDRSLDGGWSFGADRVITETPGGWDLPVPGLTRHNGMPVTAVDRSSGPNRSSIYVNWIDERNGDPDVFVMASRDGGGAWSAPVRVNDDALKNGRAQMFTWMAVDPTDGSINVVFHDRRESDPELIIATMARSVDGGRSFVNHRITGEAPFKFQPGVFFGDYNGIAAQGGRVVAALPWFKSDGQLTLVAAVFRFMPGSQETRRP